MTVTTTFGSDLSNTRPNDIALSADGTRLYASGDDGNLRAFAFVGTAAFSGTAGELRYEQVSGNTYVSGDTDGDGTADFMIRLDGTHSLNSGDFVI